MIKTGQIYTNIFYSLQKKWCEFTFSGTLKHIKCSAASSISTRRVQQSEDKFHHIHIHIHL